MTQSLIFTFNQTFKISIGLKNKSLKKVSLKHKELLIKGIARENVQYNRRPLKEYILRKLLDTY